MNFKALEKFLLVSAAVISVLVIAMIGKSLAESSGEAEAVDIPEDWWRKLVVSGKIYDSHGEPPEEIFYVGGDGIEITYEPFALRQQFTGYNQVRITTPPGGDWGAFIFEYVPDGWHFAGATRLSQPKPQEHDFEKHGCNTRLLGGKKPTPGLYCLNTVEQIMVGGTVVACFMYHEDGVCPEAPPVFTAKEGFDPDWTVAAYPTIQIGLDRMLAQIKAMEIRSERHKNGDRMTAYAVVAFGRQLSEIKEELFMNLRYLNPDKEPSL